MRIEVEPDTPALFVVYDTSGRRVSQHETMESAENAVAEATRYGVRFTPVGWQVIDTLETRDSLAEFGTGAAEYGRAKAKTDELNTHGPRGDTDA